MFPSFFCYPPPPVLTAAASPGAEDDASQAGEEIDSRPNPERWSAALRDDPSMGVFFLCYNMLHETILWSKSVLKARCKLCRKGHREDEMLLCDKCDEGFHMFCLNPPLKRIPEGDWFCPKVQKKEEGKMIDGKRIDVHKKRRTITNNRAWENKERIDFLRLLLSLLLSAPLHHHIIIVSFFGPAVHDQDGHTAQDGPKTQAE